MGNSKGKSFHKLHGTVVLFPEGRDTWPSIVQPFYSWGQLKLVLIPDKNCNSWFSVTEIPGGHTVNVPRLNVFSISYTTLGKLLNITKPQYPHLSFVDYSTTYPTGIRKKHFKLWNRQKRLTGFLQKSVPKAGHHLLFTGLFYNWPEKVNSVSCYGSAGHYAVLYLAQQSIKLYVHTHRDTYIFMKKS